jgi:DNA-directed RNA polymerase specialized sigma24 family protein
VFRLEAESVMTATTASNPDPDFEDVVRQYEREIYRLIHRAVHNPEIAEHLTQEAFLSAYRSAYRSFSSRNVDEDLRLWLCRFALEQYKAYSRANCRAAEEDASE